MTGAELIARLEAATEGCRELDVKIALFLGWTYGKRGSDRKPWWRRPGQINDYQRSSDTWASQWPNMEWTGSVDAAKTLMPPEAKGSYTIHVFENGSGAQAEVVNCLGDGKTDALALCIAAIKAMTAPSTE